MSCGVIRRIMLLLISDLHSREAIYCMAVCSCRKWLVVQPYREEDL